MNFDEALKFLYEKLPMFSRQGKAAIKKDLTNTIALCEALGNPQEKLKTIHVAGTNGKGSVSHSLASVLQEANYKVGLYTSPHLKSFTERIRLNGAEVPSDWIADFVTKHPLLIERIQPSFFEITVAMAFTFFAEKNVDIAIIETGLGGRLDSTNIIMPLVSVITNIGLDHTDMLGDTLAKIAVEKAGIIKENTPVVISETQKETEPVFFQKAHSVHAPIVFADTIYTEARVGNKIMLVNQSNGETISVQLDLLGNYQIKNAKAVLLALDMLAQKNFSTTKEQRQKGLANITKNTGLRGRFEIVQRAPLLIYDVAHNKEGVQQSLEELAKYNFEKLHIIYGCVNDKDVSSVLPLFPADAIFYFTQANVPRALPVSELAVKAAELGILGQQFSTPLLAKEAAMKNASANDCVIVIGSFFILEELL